MECQMVAWMARLLAAGLVLTMAATMENRSVVRMVPLKDKWKVAD
jgi:hypothetical protein